MNDATKTAVLGLLAVNIDLQGQRDRALVELQDLRPRLIVAERALEACRVQARTLASRPVTICQPPQPCLSIGERIRAVWGGG